MIAWESPATWGIYAEVGIPKLRTDTKVVRLWESAPFLLPFPSPFPHLLWRKARPLAFYHHVPNAASPVRNICSLLSHRDHRLFLRRRHTRILQYSFCDKEFRFFGHPVPQWKPLRVNRCPANTHNRLFRPGRGCITYGLCSQWWGAPSLRRLPQREMGTS